MGRLIGVEGEHAKYVTGFIFVPLLAVGGWLYAALSESSRYRATVGKRIMGLQVVNTDGSKLTFGQASARHVMKFLSLFSLGIGFLMAGLDQAPPGLARHPYRLSRHPRAGRELLDFREKLPPLNTLPRLSS